MAFDEEQARQRRELRQQQKANQRLIRIALTITAVTAVLCICAMLITFAIVNQPSSPSLDASQSTTSTPPTAPPPPAVPDTVIHLVVGGDVNVTDKTVSSGITAGGYDYTNAFLDLLPTLAGADLSVLNFEGCLAGEPYGSAQKSAPDALINALRGAGVDFLQTANTQSVAGGMACLKTTIQGIRQAGITPLGTYTSSAEFQQSGGFVIREVQGVRIAFVAFTKGMGGSGLLPEYTDCVNLLYTDYTSTYQTVDTEGIAQILKNVQTQKPDITVALLHWGSEGVNKVSKTQEKIAKLMFENGVDAILGSHSHLVQSVTYDKEAGTLLAYSLGDFWGDASAPGMDYSVVLDLEITKDGSSGDVKLTGYEYIPVYLEDNTETGEGIRVLRIREAITAYEQNFISKVSEETYLGMKNALSKIESRMG